jgi:hypothetical protein
MSRLYCAGRNGRYLYFRHDLIVFLRPTKSKRMAFMWTPHPRNGAAEASLKPVQHALGCLRCIRA